MGLFDRFQGKSVSGASLRFLAGGKELLHMRLDRQHFLAHDRATQLLRDRIVLPLLGTRTM
jgi:hypothetical protein